MTSRKRSLALGLIASAVLFAGGGGSAIAAQAPDVISIRPASYWFSVNEGFAVYAKAIDPATGKVDKSFHGPATLTDTSGRLIVTQNDGFTNGEFYAAVKVPIPYHHDAITITPPSPSAPKTSASFNIEGPFQRLAVGYPGSPQTAGVPFDISFNAYDSLGWLLTRSNFAVQISDTSGSISVPGSTGPSVTPSWDNGRATVRVVVSKPFVHDVIRVTPVLPGSSTAFSSGNFNVRAAPAG